MSQHHTPAERNLTARGQDPSPPDEATRKRLAAIGSIGGLRTASLHDPHATMRKAREGLWQKYLDQVDPDRELPEDERVRRADRLRRADLRERAMKANKARMAKKRANPGGGGR